MVVGLCNVSVGTAHACLKAKPRLGRVSKAGQRDILRLLIIGAMSRLNWLGRKSIREGA